MEKGVIHIRINYSILATLATVLGGLVLELRDWKHDVDIALGDPWNSTQAMLFLTTFAHDNDLEPPSLESFKTAKAIAPRYNRDDDEE